MRQSRGADRHQSAPPQGAVRFSQGPSAVVEANWDWRLHAGLRVACVPTEARSALAQALGEAGVEAEFFLVLVQRFPGTLASRAQGEIFLLQLEAAARRLCRVASSLEVAVQGFLAGLEAGYPDLRSVGEFDDVWWPAFPGYALAGEALEVRLRRCGYAYRHVVETHLAASVEAICEQMAFTLHALNTLPPAGVVPARALYQGLYELSSAWQGDVAQNHVLDVSPAFHGLLTGITRLRAMDAREDASLESDLAWAHGQYALARGTQEPAAPSSGPPPPAHMSQWAALAAQDWYDTITALERLRQSLPSGVASPPR
ncbi:MAG: hypothetical protein IVW57_12150 [Ktedonobacterales bacterium]|nr:hypothetical protein [Ktedonobacterales bacterium]